MALLMLMVPLFGILEVLIGIQFDRLVDACNT